MVKENDLRKELLRQMDKSHGEASGAGVKSPRDFIERDSARVKRLRWVVMACWLLVMIFFMVAGIVECNIKGIESDALYVNTMWISVAVLILRAMLLIALVLTISLYVRSRTLTMHQIQARLGKIEEQLRRISHDV
ncbi:MAG: hypothetical protein ABIF19_18650 [Planctomycetota bacterium]